MLNHEEIRTIISALGAGIGEDEFDLEKCRYGKIILMTDADIDGAHIRTLLLTFLFRQMPQLLINNMIYIAQPPLYEVREKGRKKSEYILSEAKMRNRLMNRGLEGTELVIRENGKNRRVDGGRLKALVKLLGDIERLIPVLGRRGINFEKFIQTYYDNGKLPSFLVRNQGQEEVFFDKTAFEKRVDELSKGLLDEDDSVEAEELREVDRINQVNRKLKEQFELELKDYLLKAEKKVSGESQPTRFMLTLENEEYDVPDLGGVCPTIRQIGGKGVDIKRFKGLGEMNSEQLWQTTMNPESRTLLSVRIEDAGEADRLFSILMGSDVEKRRNFIQDHALEVQNLDV